MGTGYVNLQGHLTREHTQEYNKAIKEHKWHYKLLTQTDASIHDARKAAI